MNISITAKNENKLLSRMDIAAELSFEKATPSENEVKEGLSKALEVDKELIVIQKIATSFGMTQAKVAAHQYFNKEDILKLEPKVARTIALEKRKAQVKAEEKK